MRIIAVGVSARIPFVAAFARFEEMVVRDAFYRDRAKCINYFNGTNADKTIVYDPKSFAVPVRT